MKFQIDITHVERTTVRHTINAHTREEAMQLALDGEGDTEIIDTEVGDIDGATVVGTRVLDLSGMFGPCRKIKKRIM